MQAVYKLITPPDYATALPITLATAKEQLGIDQAYVADDALITDCIKSAAAEIEARLQGPLQTQTWLLQMPAFTASPLPDNEGIGARLWKSPVVSATVKYMPLGGGAEATVDSANYYLDIASNPARIIFKSTYVFPSVDERFDAVRIQFVCGYDPANIPSDLKMFIKVLTARYYEHRDFQLEPRMQFELNVAIQRHMAWL